MSEAASWGLIGHGNIGSEVLRQLEQPAVADRMGLSPLPEYVIRSTARMESDGQTSTGFAGLDGLDVLPDVTFVTLPSTDDGVIATNYIDAILDRGKTVITAEKGALANNFADLKERSDNFGRLGINATVGGGTRLISTAREYCRDVDNVTQIHLALNGTLAAIFGSIAPLQGSGMSLGQAVQQAVTLGYAEPGSSNPKDVIRAEAQGDIPKKTAIFFNSVGLSDWYLDWKTLHFELSNQQIDQAVEEATIRRFIVSLYPAGRSVKPESDQINCIDKVHDGWHIVAGFRHIDRNPLFAPLAKLSGPGNGFVIGVGPDESDGVYSLVGPGAGPRPTVNTMLDDYLTRR